MFLWAWLGLGFFICFKGVFAEIEDLSLYPIVINTDFDKAVLILPDQGCHVIQDVRTLQRLMPTRNHHQQPNVYRADNETVENLIDLCELFQSDQINATQFVIGLQRSWLIFPGTKYCGAGNSAANYSDLGTYIETDKCCRDHDFCMDYVDGWSCHPKMSELCNPAPFTRSHCDCDKQFRECLQNSNETASRQIGVLFFTVFGLKCFREDHPIIECEEYGGFLNLHCQHYLLDTTKERMFQFFDSPKFSRNTTTMASNNTALNAYELETALSPQILDNIDISHNL